MKSIILFYTALLLHYGASAQTSGKQITQQQKQAKFQRIMQDFAYSKSWYFVKMKLDHPKSIKFADVYDWGDGLGDSSYMVSSHFTYKGKYGETVGRYYYCYLKIIDIKKEIWQLQKIEISPYPFKNGD